MKIDKIKKVIPKSVKKNIKKIINIDTKALENKAELNSKNYIQANEEISEFKRLVKNQTVKRQKNKNYDFRATYVETLHKPLKKQIIIIGSTGGSFSGAALSKFAEILTRENMDVIVALDKLSDPFPYVKIKKVKKYSIDYVKALAQSKVVLTQGTLPYYFLKRDNQTVINTLDEFIGQIDSITWPLRTQGVRLQHSLLQSNELIGVPGVNIKEILSVLRIDRIYQGTIVKNYDIINHFQENVMKNIEKFPLKIPYAIKIFKKESKKLDIVLIHLKKVHNTNIVNSLKNLINQKQENNKLILIDALPHIHKELYKDDLLKKNMIGINRNIEPYLLNVTELYTDDLDYSSLFTDIKVNLIVHQQDETYSFRTVDLSKKKEQILSVINNKKNILMYGGGFYNNGITSSVLNLSNYLDYEKYNLIILEKGEFKGSDNDNIQKLNPKTTVVQRFGVSVFDEKEQALHELITLKSGYQKWMGEFSPFNQYRREVKRMTGMSYFDYAVDFGGYSSYYEALILSVKAKKHSIFLHNDMWEETKRFVDGKFIMKDTLMRIFKLYQFFDCYVSVSEEVMKQNQLNLTQYTDVNKFFTVNNLINKKDIQTKRFDENIALIKVGNENFYIGQSLSDGKYIETKAFLAPSDNKFTFVMAGRLSPEKDHKKMIDAVKNVQNNTQKEFEILVLGEGPLKEELNKYKLIQGVGKTVKFVGQVPNPYYYFEQADAFLMTSNHEGQPMVLLEAASMSLPILATDIPGNRSVVSQFGGKLVNNTMQSLQLAMQKMIENPQNLESPKFDIDKYNEVTYQEFERTVLGE